MLIVKFRAFEVNSNLKVINDLSYSIEFVIICVSRLGRLGPGQFTLQRKDEFCCCCRFRCFVGVGQLFGAFSSSVIPGFALMFIFARSSEFIN